MAPVAPLSFTSKYGYYGLRVNPTFDQVAATVRKPLRIPIPDRSAKWYALSAYRGLILDAEAKYQDYQHAQIDYRQSGANLPESAAAVKPSDAGGDAMFDEIHRQHDAFGRERAHADAAALVKAERMRQTAQARREHLGAQHSAGLQMHPVIEAAHDELEEAQVPHAAPPPTMPPPNAPYRAPPPQYVAAGQPQAPEFTPFEQLNMGQPDCLRAGNTTISQGLTYERIRDFVVEPTWSS